VTRALGLFLVCLLTLTVSSTSARADDVYTVIIKKQEAKKASQWSLADWLQTRNFAPTIHRTEQDAELIADRSGISPLTVSRKSWKTAADSEFCRS
jgi:hypothetical protein